MEGKRPFNLEGLGEKEKEEKGPYLLSEGDREKERRETGRWHGIQPSPT